MTRVRLYYRPEMVPDAEWVRAASPSPLKPRLFRDQVLADPDLRDRIEERDDWPPVARDDLLLAHSAEYVEAFLAGVPPLCQSNGLPWTPGFARSVLHTNGSLVAAVLGALADPNRLHLSPTSGFHHATPHHGGGFCTFSGQVIAALRAYHDGGHVGAWVDLDGHYGNSIEDSRAFCSRLDRAIPLGCNINPRGVHGAYLADLSAQLAHLEGLLLADRVQYVAVAHGADSHEDDPLGGQCNTQEWLEAARMVHGMLSRVAARRGRPVPTVLALFGGYRQDFEFVLRLHAADLRIALGLADGWRD